MSIFNTIDIDVMSLVILALILYHCGKRAEYRSLQRKLFLLMIAALSIILIADTLQWIIDGRPGAAYRTANWVLTLLIYLPVPAIPAIYALYTDYQVLHDDRRLVKLRRIMLVYVLWDQALMLISVWLGWYFTIDAGNRLRRGPFLAVHTLSCYAVLAYTVLFVIRNRQRVDPRRFITLLTFGAPAALAGVIEILFADVNVMWGGMALSVLLLYINMQDKQLDTDYLTGTYNRRLLDVLVEHKIRSTARGKSFSAVLIDLDNFKQINDTYGHNAGDEALQDAVALLKSCLRHGDMVSRYGGDEFLIILDIDNPAVLKDAVARIEACFNRFNLNGVKPYRLSFSTGYAVYDMAGGMDPEQFIKHIDTLMYEDKKLGSGEEPKPEAASESKQ